MSQPDAQARADLEALFQSRPRLRPLLSKLVLVPTVQWDKAFFVAFRKSTLKYKALILRVLFDDTSLFKRGGEPQLSPAVARRVRVYIENLPGDPLRTGLASRDLIPKPLSRLFGLDRGSWLEVSGEIVRRLWPDGVDADGDWSAEVCAELMPIACARVLTTQEADRLISNGLETAAGHYYFDIADADAMSVRNMLVYLGRLFAHGRNAGREQNLIPIQVSHRFGIRPRCVPEALAVVDVLALYAHGCITVPRKEDPLGIRGIFEHPVPGGFDGFWRDALEPHLARVFVCDPNEVIENGQFDTGFRYNVARLAGLVDGRTTRLVEFAPYYARANRQELLRLGLMYWGRVSATASRRCKALARRVSPVIRLRDLGNIVCTVDPAPLATPLPSVARFALGEPEPVYTGRLAGRETEPRKRADKPTFKQMPELTRLLRQLDRRAVD